MLQYKGISYEVSEQQSRVDGNWRWAVHTEHGTKQGKSSLRYTAIQNAKRTIDKLLKGAKE